jgi:hypothetical protein
MRDYVNPENESLEAWLEREGEEVDWRYKPQWDDMSEEYLPVVLINNPKIICWSQKSRSIKGSMSRSSTRQISNDTRD